MVSQVSTKPAAPQGQRYPHGVHHHGFARSADGGETGRSRITPLWATASCRNLLGYRRDFTRDGSCPLFSFQQIKEDGTTDTLYLRWRGPAGSGQRLSCGDGRWCASLWACLPFNTWTAFSMGTGWLTQAWCGMSLSEVRQGYLESSNVDWLRWER